MGYSIFLFSKMEWMWRLKFIIKICEYRGRLQWQMDCQGYIGNWRYLVVPLTCMPPSKLNSGINDLINKTFGISPTPAFNNDWKGIPWLYNVMLCSQLFLQSLFKSGDELCRTTLSCTSYVTGKLLKLWKSLFMQEIFIWDIPILLD